MKRIIALLLVAVCIFGLCACSGFAKLDGKYYSDDIDGVYYEFDGDDTCYLTDAQKTITEKGIKALEAESGQAVYISVEPFKSFYPAEEEHQDYYLKHPEEFKQELIDSGRISAE